MHEGLKPIHRVFNLSENHFKENYLKQNQPVIITGEVENWPAASNWQPQYLSDHFGSQQVQLYNHSFDLIGIISLNEYIDQYFGKESKDDSKIPYIRWYTQLKNHSFEWSDNFFAKIVDQWQNPSFLPQDNYILPFSPTKTSPVTDNFPAKGIFISAKGAKTSLHKDPWSSDAILCQIYGEKKLILYAPDQENKLIYNDKFVNLENPDDALFPKFKEANVSYIDILKPGEIVFLPRGWLHQVNTLSDSISITWNFVHITTYNHFYKYLTQKDLTNDELEVLEFFINRI